MTRPHSKSSYCLKSAFRRHAQVLHQQKKLTSEDLIDLAVIEQREDTEEAELEYLTGYYREMIYRVCNGLLDRLKKMATAIENEPPGKRKEMMLNKYDETDKELEEWQNMKTNSDMLCALDSLNFRQ